MGALEPPRKMRTKALNSKEPGSDNSTMEKKENPLRSRAAVVALCASLFVVIGGRVPVSGMVMLHETSLSTVEPSGAGQVRTPAPAERRDPAGRNRVAQAKADRRQARAVAPTGPPESFDPSPGQVVFRMDIPAIDSHEVVVQGVEAAQLARGPGHYPSCGVYFQPPYCSEFEQVWPGEVGRTVVGGHRTMAGADFFDLGDLRAGDEIRINASWGDFVYRVTRQEIVDDGDRSVIVPGVEERELVLVTCHPKFSSAQRLITYARLVPAGDRVARSESVREFAETGV